MTTRTFMHAMACTGGLLLSVRPLPAATPAPVTPGQLDADIRRQLAVRVFGPSAEAVTPAQDAAGGVDGVKDGTWGFHTAREANPWWDVDLGGVRALDRVVLYNRGDEFGNRNRNLAVELSADGRDFTRVFRNDALFGGAKDGRPLSIPLAGARARFVRLALDGEEYLHLDEVEVFAPGEGDRNMALNRPARQSSVSPWSRAHGGPAEAGPVIARGLALARRLAEMGVDTRADAAALEACKGRPAAEAPGAAAAVVRALALKNPLLDFEDIVFVKSAPTLFPHISDQFYGWWSRPGGGVYVLEQFRSPEPRLRCLTEGLPPGSFIRPELSFDGRRVLFAYARQYPEVRHQRDKMTKANLPEDAFYHLYEVNLDGTGLRRLTRGRYDDFDGRYLPGGDIIFLSTRKGVFLQNTQSNTLATLTADLPDSYVRCGGDRFRPVPVFTLHRMNGAGEGLRPISSFETFEYTPALAPDGRILYTRWDYIDRFNGHFFSLWSTQPDGMNAQLVYGNYTVRPQAVTEAVPIPGSRKLVFTASAHHSILGGALALFDRTRGDEGEAPLVRITPEVPFPETERNVDCYYANPHPLSEEFFLVGWADRPLPAHTYSDERTQNPVNAMGLYLYDVTGNLVLLHRDPELSSSCPIPVRPRPVPAEVPEDVAWAGRQEGVMVLQDVYAGLPGVARGTVTHVRVVASLPKVQPFMNQPVIGVSNEDTGKFVLGTARVEADGSASFRLPSGVPVFFQALDAGGRAVQTMRSLTYVPAGRTLSCVGCHEPRAQAPAVGPVAARAARRAPERLEADVAGTWPLRYDVLVQPVLDRHCAACHAPGGEGEKLDLTPSKSYASLLNHAGGDLRKLAFEKDRSVAGDAPSFHSRVAAVLRQGHRKVALTGMDWRRLYAWMDLYATRQGHFSPEQEAEVERFRAAAVAPH